MSQDVSSLSQVARRLVEWMKADASLVERLVEVERHIPNCQAWPLYCVLAKNGSGCVINNMVKALLRFLPFSILLVSCLGVDCVDSDMYKTQIDKFISVFGSGNREDIEKVVSSNSYMFTEENVEIISSIIKKHNIDKYLEYRITCLKEHEGTMLFCCELFQSRKASFKIFLVREGDELKVERITFNPHYFED